MKRFPIDEDLPRSLAAALSAAGMEAVHVVDAGLLGAIVVLEPGRVRLRFP